MEKKLKEIAMILFGIFLAVMAFVLETVTDADLLIWVIILAAIVFGAEGLFNAPEKLAASYRKI